MQAQHKKCGAKCFTINNLTKTSGEPGWKSLSIKKSRKFVQAVCRVFELSPNEDFTQICVAGILGLYKQTDKMRKIKKELLKVFLEKIYKTHIEKLKKDSLVTYMFSETKLGIVWLWI